MFQKQKSHRFPLLVATLAMREVWARRLHGGRPTITQPACGMTLASLPMMRPAAQPVQARPPSIPVYGGTGVCSTEIKRKKKVREIEAGIRAYRIYDIRSWKARRDAQYHPVNM